jgi:hypothetical protein
MAKHKRHHDAMMNRDVAGREGQQHGAMIKNDRSMPSNLPQDVMMRSYPEQGFFNSYIDDSIYGIDGQHEEGVKGLKRQVRSRMF